MPKTEVQEKAGSPEEGDVTEGAQAMSTILNAVKENPSLAEDPEIAKVVDMAGGAPPSKQKAPKEELRAEKEPEPEQETEEEPKSRFFKEEREEIEQEIGDIEEHIRDKYSIEDTSKAEIVLNCTGPEQRLVQGAPRSPTARYGKTMRKLRGARHPISFVQFSDFCHPIFSTST